MNVVQSHSFSCISLINASQFQMASQSGNMSNPVPMKLLKEVTQNQSCAIMVRIASVQCTYRCKNESFCVSFQVVDQQNTRARVICYSSNKELCERYENQMKVNHVFQLQRFTLKRVLPQYRIGDFPFDFQLTVYSKVIAVAEEVGSLIPSITFSYISVSEIADHPVGSVISCLVYIQSVDELVVDDGCSPVRMTRMIRVGDAYNDEINVTLWNDRAKNCTLKERSVVAIHCAKVSSYQGLSLQANSGTQIVVDPPDSEQVRKLYSIVGSRKRKADGIAIGDASTSGCVAVEQVNTN